MSTRAAVAIAAIAAIAGGVAVAERPVESPRVESAESARAIIAKKIEPRRVQSRARLLALYRSSSRVRPLFEPERRWHQARARADLIRVLRRDLGELSALENELVWVSKAAKELAPAIEERKKPRLLRPVANSPVKAGFGPYLSSRRIRSVRTGVVLTTTAASAIRAPVAGRIVYSGEVAGLGEAAVIESGGHWITCGPLNLQRPLGAEVRLGEVIGQTTENELFVELRRADSRGGLPIDPRPFAD